MAKKRLDILLVERGLALSQDEARRIILAAEVTADGQTVGQPSARVDETADIAVKEAAPYVSRGGLKLAGALDAFGLDVQGLVAADVGASTGGFTDCLLQRGAAKVYAIDVGYGQLAYRLRQDPRIVVMERVNARHGLGLPEKVDMSTVDLSFISLTLVLPAVAQVLKPGGRIVALIKPQFEAARAEVGEGGIVRDPQVHGAVIGKVGLWAIENGLRVLDVVPSPILGQEGNREFFILLEKPGDPWD